MNSKQVEVSTAIEEFINQKFRAIQDKNVNMPFLEALIGKDCVYRYSLSHSIATSLGSFYQDLALIFCGDVFSETKKQFKVPNVITVEARDRIEEILVGLYDKSASANHAQEIAYVREVADVGDTVRFDTTKADLSLKSSNVQYLIELKTAKPNKGNWKDFKRTLLVWSAGMLYQDPDLDIRALVGIPYNPSAPLPYRPWQQNDIFDITSDQKQLLVGAELWEFFSGQADAMNLIIDGIHDVRGKLDIDSRFLRILDGVDPQSHF